PHSRKGRTTCHQYHQVVLVYPCIFVAPPKEAHVTTKTVVIANIVETFAGSLSRCRDPDTRSRLIYSEQRLGDRALLWLGGVNKLVLTSFPISDAHLEYTKRCLGYTNVATFGRILENIDHVAKSEWQIAYAEVNVSVFAPHIQQLLLGLGFMPAAYCPSMAT